MRLAYILTILLVGYVLYGMNVYAQSSSLEAASDDAIHDSIPYIPEPMVFDFVRPLGAKKGELEVNTLIQRHFNNGINNIFWSPEIEYVLRDGLAVEFELPIRDTDIEALKFALQGTLGTAFKNKFIHGLQALYRYERLEKGFLGEGLYIFGYRFNNRFSVLNMKGIRRASFPQQTAIRGLFNNTLFFDISDKLIVGLETNFRYGKSKGNYLLLMPQAHVKIAKKLTFQFGFGIEKLSGEKIHPTSSVRVIKEF